MTDQAQSEYYQAIAREFLRRRGASFFLSPRDLAVIADWERKGIPLRVVIEGIGRAFDGRRNHSRGTKGLPLSFCEPHVLRAMAQHTDRAAGRRKPPAPRSSKVDKARGEAGRFLADIPAGDKELFSLFEKAAGLLAKGSSDEEALERIDGEVDALLWGRVPVSERDGLTRQMARDLAGRDAAEVEAAVRTRVIKASRRKQKIPYVSLFYY
jgi:hypothetical protein